MALGSSYNKYICYASCHVQQAVQPGPPGGTSSLMRLLTLLATNTTCWIVSPWRCMATGALRVRLTFLCIFAFSGLIIVKSVTVSSTRQLSQQSRGGASKQMLAVARVTLGFTARATPCSVHWRVRVQVGPTSARAATQYM